MYSSFRSSSTVHNALAPVKSFNILLPVSEPTDLYLLAWKSACSKGRFLTSTISDIAVECTSKTRSCCYLNVNRSLMMQPWYYRSWWSSLEEWPYLQTPGYIMPNYTYMVCPEGQFGLLHKSIRDFPVWLMTAQNHQNVLSSWWFLYTARIMLAKR